MSDLNKKPPRKAGAVGAATEAIVDKRAALVNTLTHDGSHNNASRQHAAAPTDKLPSFPTMLRKMWSGTEVQRWIDDNIKPLMQERYFEFHCAPDATPAAAISCDVEQMLRDCVPGGSIVDPQLVADSIREWFAERPPIAAYDGTHIQNHCPECSELESECMCAQEVATNDESEDAYVIRRLSEALADISITLRGDDAPLVDEPINPIDRVRQLAQVLRMEVELYRARVLAEAEPGASL